MGKAANAYLQIRTLGTNRVTTCKEFGVLVQGDCKVRKNRQGRQERQGNEVKNSYFHRLVLFFLGDLGALGGSKIDFAIALRIGRSGSGFCALLFGQLLPGDLDMQCNGKSLEDPLLRLDSIRPVASTRLPLPSSTQLPTGHTTYQDDP